MAVHPSASVRPSAPPPAHADASPEEQPVLRQYLSIGQGLYFLGTGVWSLVSIETFQRVTGPKTDLWLVKTVGSIVSVIGGVLILAGIRQRITPEVTLLATGSAAALTAIDVVYVSKRRISPIYLLDAVAELLIIAAWIFTGGQRSRRPAGRIG
jgi:hypothetical protein